MARNRTNVKNNEKIEEFSKKSRLKTCQVCINLPNSQLDKSK